MFATTNLFNFNLLKEIFMSVEEMKMEVIKGVIQLKTEDAVREISEHLSKLNSTNASINLSKQYEAVKNQYSDVLQKLAQ